MHNGESTLRPQTSARIIVYLLAKAKGGTVRSELIAGLCPNLFHRQLEKGFDQTDYDKTDKPTQRLWTFRAICDQWIGCRKSNG